MRILPLLVLILLLAAPGVTQTVEDEVESEAEYEFLSEDDTVCYTSGCLDPSEMEIYRSVRDEIERRLPYEGEPSGLLPVVEELLFRIEELPIREVARHGLLQQVGYRALEDEPPGGAAFYVLLGSEDPDIQHFAFGPLFNDAGGWVDDAKLVETLLELLDEPRADRHVRISVLWLFSQAEAFDRVAERARRLASDSSDLELAHRAARVVTVEMEDRPDDLERLYRSSRGPLRQWAAMRLAGHGEEPLESLVVAELRAVAIDPDLPPWVRGDAIEEIGINEERPQNREILLELLEPEHWFFGVQGAHFEIHSLAVVVRALADLVDEPAIREVLAGLYPAIASLRVEERDYVEWELELALKMEEPASHSPVDPERRP